MVDFAQPSSEMIEISSLFFSLDVRKQIREIFAEFDKYEDIIPEPDKETLDAFNSIFTNGHTSYKKFLVIE